MALFVHSNLRQLIVTLALISTVVSVVNMFVSSLTVQKYALIENTLDSNQAYASKLAESTQFFLENIQTQLAYSADLIANNWSNPEFLHQEITKTAKQNQTFSSVLLFNSQGVILAASNNISAYIGEKQKSLGIQQSLKEHKPLISTAYLSPIKNLVIMISTPIFAKDGRYLGFLGGSIYLREKNVLNHLLGEHIYQDGSYIYVIDQEKRLLYHPHQERLGERVINNPVIDEALAGKGGQAQITNSQDVDMLTGYAYIPAANWGLVVQRPLQSTLSSLENQMYNMVMHSFPINLAMLLLIWCCAWLISNPLRQLTKNVKDMKQRSTIEQVKNINAWYFEAHELKQAFLFGLQNVHDHVVRLNLDIRTDPLTGLSNRRTLDYLLNKFSQTQTPFSAITLDIDHFKYVNDTYGHDIGDIVLKELAAIMRNTSREQDFCIRLGGEEFLIILPQCPPEIAISIAERLRTAVAEHIFYMIEHITISLGVASWPTHGELPHHVLKTADEMLYAAKQNGRNQVQVATK